MSAHLVYINGFELGASKTDWAVGDPGWTFSEYRGTVDTASTEETHQPMGKSAPYAGSYSMKFNVTNHTSYPGPDLHGRVILDCDDGANGNGGRVVFSHYHGAGVWGTDGRAGDDKVVFQVYGAASNQMTAQVLWRPDGKLDLYVYGVYKETTTLTIPDESWTRIGLVWTVKPNGSHRRAGARLYINGDAATSWHNHELSYRSTGTTVEFKWQGNHQVGSTFVDHIAVTSDDSISYSDGTTSSTGPYIDTESWNLIVPGLKPNSDITAFDSGNFAPNTGSSKFGVIDESPISSSDYVQATTDPSSFGCQLSNLDGSFDVGTVIKGVQASFVAYGDGTMLSSESKITRGPGAGHDTNQSAAKAHTLNTSATIVNHVVEEDPGGGDWTVSDVNNIGFKYTTT